jgi:hypothetical protein
VCVGVWVCGVCFGVCGGVSGFVAACVGELLIKSDVIK